MKTKELTRAEEQIMQVLWKLQKAFVNEIIEQLPIPKPAYNTVSTIIRIMESKGFVSHEVFGKTHRYYPVLSKEEYTDKSLKRLLKNYFDNSFQNMVSFLAKTEKINKSELELIKKMIDEELNNQRP